MEGSSQLLAMRASNLLRMMRACLLAALAAAIALTPAVADTNGPPAPETALVEYRALDRVAAAEGVVEAVRQSTLAAQVAGRIVALNVRAGDSVRAGQVLAQIDARSVVQAESASQSQVREARANLANVKAKYERSRQLFAQKFISQAALDQAQTEYLAAQEQTAAAIANAGQAATSKSFATISAPYAGVIASTDVEVGDMATPGRPLLTVFDPRELRVTALRRPVLVAAKLDAPASRSRRSVACSPRRVSRAPVADTLAHPRVHSLARSGGTAARTVRAGVVRDRTHACTRDSHLGSAAAE
jgi:multidrug efflux pump subunit AcrA (membrane-fusion protein)